MINRLFLVFALQFIIISALAVKLNEKINWNDYKRWNDSTIYKKIIFVDQNHPLSSDQNVGSFDQPLKTIRKASEMVQPGEKVIVMPGVYRETIEPKRGGLDTKSMITYEAHSTGSVIIKGSLVLKQEWFRSKKKIENVSPDGKLESKWRLVSNKLWMTNLPDSIFEKHVNPFKTSNVTEKDFFLMPWARKWKGQYPYNLVRGNLFINEVRFIQITSYDDLVKFPGTYWIDTTNNKIHIHPYNYNNPNSCTVEVTNKKHLLNPKISHLGFIQIIGFTFEHCANGFIRTGSGALFTRGGHHWIIKKNTIRHINSSGLEFGTKINEKVKKNQLKDSSQIGFNMVQKNIIYDCGTAGIRSHSVFNSIIKDNIVYDCGWQDAEFYWECAGIKLLRVEKTLIAGNIIRNINGGVGIWIDWNNKYTRITGNVLHNISANQGAIFVEASQYPNLVDNNFIWGIQGQGITIHDSDNILIAHNLVGLTSRESIFSKTITKRKTNEGRLVSSENIKVLNNIFINFQNEVYMDTKSSIAENNYFIKKLKKKEEYEQGNNLNNSPFDFDTDSLIFVIQKEISPVPTISFMKVDFFGQKRTKSETLPGPFSVIPSNRRINLINDHK